MTFASSRPAAALRRLTSALRRVRLPRRTVRLRLTALYGALFLLSGAALLVFTNVLVHRQSSGAAFFIDHRPGQLRPQIKGVVGGFSATIGVPPGVAVVTRGKTGTGGVVQGGPLLPPAGPAVLRQQLPGPTLAQVQAQAHQLRTLARKQHDNELQHLLAISGIALGVMAVISVALGWLISGRVLRPLRTMTSTTHSITERNLHERLSLGGPDDELKDLANTIDGLLVRLEAAFDAQRRFVANASHELRTPLAMMRTSLDVAAAKPGGQPPPMAALDGKLREGLDQAERLLEGFLTLARAQHGALPEQASVSLSQIALGAIRTRSALIAEHGLAVEESIADAHVRGSETLLARIVANLVDNAIHHNQRGGWMRVCTSCSHDHATATLVVESGGPHLQQSAVDQLAQPFRRLGAERTGSERGVGLGLSIVAAIASAHGGELQLHARPEGGLRAQVDLPRSAPGSADPRDTGSHDEFVAGAST